MNKKGLKRGLLAIICVFLIGMNGIVASAKKPMEQCYVYITASELDKRLLTAYQIHQGRGPYNSNDYLCWVTTDGGMYWFHETWTCGDCGHFIMKDTWFGSITYGHSEEENDVEMIE